MAAQRKNPQIENVVMMLPSSIRCTPYSTVMAKGTELNSRKEEALGEEFWEVWKDHTFRFCFNCTQCSAELVIRTDPQYSHLAVEAGASKCYPSRFIPWLPPMVELEEKGKLVPYTDPNWQENREEALVNRLQQIIDKHNQKRKIEEAGDAMKSLDFKKEI